METGLRHHNARDLTGQTFGMLTALSVESAGRGLRWRFACQCGAQCVKAGQDVTKEVKRGGTPNCGCMTGRLIGSKNITHGMSRHKAYAVYRSMVDRCTLETHRAWANYGGRGIKVCDAWLGSFEAFWQDMGGTYKPNLDLDRKDNEAGYSPENCHWVTRRENAMNKRTTIRAIDIPKLSAETCISRSTLYARVRSGWPLEKLTTPPAPTNRCSTSSTAAPCTGSSCSEAPDPS